MKKLFKKNKELLKKLLEDQKQVEKLNLSEDIRKLEELKSLLKK